MSFVAVEKHKTEDLERRPLSAQSVFTCMFAAPDSWKQCCCNQTGSLFSTGGGGWLGVSVGFLYVLVLRWNKAFNDESGAGMSGDCIIPACVCVCVTEREPT